MDDDLERDASDRGDGDDVSDQLSHGDSDDSDTELNNLPEISTPGELKIKPVLPLQESEHDSFQRTRSSTFTPTTQLPPKMQRQVSLQNQGRDFMDHIPLSPHCSTDQAFFSLRKEVVSPDSDAYTVPVYVQPHHQQFFQQPSRYQQLQHQVNPLSFLTTLPHSSKFMQAPVPIMITPAQKSSLEMSLEQLSTEPTAEEIEELEQIIQSVETFQNLKVELDSGMCGDLPNARPHGNTGEETDVKMSDGDRCDSDKEIYDLDVYDDDEKEDFSQPLNLTMSGKYKATTNEQAVPTRNREQSHDTPFSRHMVTGVMGRQSANQDRDLMYRKQQNPQLQTNQEAFTSLKEKLSSEAFVHTVSESTAAQQQYQQRIQEQPGYQQDRLHVNFLSGRDPLSRSLTDIHAASPLMSTLARKRPSQTTLGHLSTTRNPEEIMKMEDIQQSVLNLKKQRKDIDSRMDGELLRARSHSSIDKYRDDKTSDEGKYYSDKEINVSRVPQHTERNLEQTKEEMHKLAETFKIRRTELGFTQVNIAIVLNKLSQEHKMAVSVSQRTIWRLEAQQLSVRRMLTLKPLLEIWLESARNQTPLGSMNAKKPYPSVNSKESTF